MPGVVVVLLLVVLDLTLGPRLRLRVQMTDAIDAFIRQVPLGGHRSRSIVAPRVRLTFFFEVRTTVRMRARNILFRKTFVLRRSALAGRLPLANTQFNQYFMLGRHFPLRGTVPAIHSSLSESKGLVSAV